MVPNLNLPRLGLALAGVAAFLVAFFVRDEVRDRRAEERAFVKVERATNEAVSKAQSAGAKSRSAQSSGVLNPNYRD
jgi:Flp pilus assembly protein TadB